MVVDAVLCELVSDEFPDLQGKYREHLLFMPISPEHLFSTTIYMGLIQKFPILLTGNFSELSVAAATSLFGFDSGATTNTHGPFLLSGKVFDEDGEPLYQSQAHKQGKRYAYYISKHLMHGANKRNEGWRLPTATLEDAVILPLKNYLQDQAGLMDALYLKEHSPVVLSKLKTQSARVTHQITDGEFQEKRSILQTIIERVDLSSNTITLTINTEGLAETLDIACPENTDPISITIPIRLRRRGVEAKLIIQGSNAELSNVDTNLCRLVAQAKNWFDQLASGKFATVLDIAQHENTPASEITRILPLAFLAPSLVEDILNGQQAHGVTVYNLKRLSPLPLNWKSQTKTLDSLA